ncbi:hypothetical protein R80B4_03257 [Fibrobacteres bacterium R8-0-B4]
MPPKNKKSNDIVKKTREAEAYPASSDAESAVFSGIRAVLVTARQKAYAAVNSAMVEAYWDIGRQIEHAVGDRAEYGKKLLQGVSKKLSAEFGKGFTVRNLQAMRQFYEVFPNTHALRAELSWTHYRLLMKIDNAPRREFYLKECAEKNETMAKYSVLSDKDNLFASKYMLYLPTEEELRREIERERAIIESCIGEE